jgi:hypothetical protein
VAVDVAACAIGRVAPDGPWVGFAPTMDGGYDLVVGDAGRSRRAPMAPDELVALAAAYFEESLDAPPDELAATHGDIAALVRHAAEHEADPVRRRVLAEAVDAIDDGLAADVTIARLTRAMGGGADATSRVRRRVDELLGSS